MDSLILGILGEILGSNILNTNVLSKENSRFTKKKYGDSYIEKALSKANRNITSFFLLGGVNKDISNDKYSFGTLMLMATLKGILNNKNNYKKSCEDEYVRVYNKLGPKKLDNTYFMNNVYIKTLESLSDKTGIYSRGNDASVITRALPFGLLFWKKEQRKELITEIINNISLTNKNNTCYLAAITLGLFVSFKKNGIDKKLWKNKLVEYLLSSNFDDIIKEMKLYSTEFLLDKEDYISLWDRVIPDNRNPSFESKLQMMMIRPRYLFYIFNDVSGDEFIYGLKADEAIIIAYESLLLGEDNWEKMIVYGVLGITDNSIMGMLCGMLFGIDNQISTNKSINVEQFRNENWVKKILSMGKELKLEK